MWIIFAEAVGISWRRDKYRRRGFIKRTRDGDRITKLLDSLKQSKLEFSKSIGFANANQINAILSGRKNISAKLAYQIEKAYPQFTFSWILNGEGEMV